MSFICGICGNPQPTLSLPNKVITQKRKRAYMPREDWKGNKDKGGFGWEIVNELLVCNICYKGVKI